MSVRKKLTETQAVTTMLDAAGLFELLAEIGSEVPAAEWKTLPEDLARNFEDYEYGGKPWPS
jgi:hypothetical protein